MRRILLPQIKPGITTAVIFVFIPILGEYLTPQLVGGARGRDDRQPDRRTSSRARSTRAAPRRALLIAALIVVLLVVFRRSLEVADAYARVTLEVVSPRARARRAALLGGWAVLVYFFLFAPIVLLVAFSFNANQYGTFPITGWTTQLVPPGLRRLPDPGRAHDDAAGRGRGDARSARSSAPRRRSRSCARGCRSGAGSAVGMTLPIMIPGLLIGVSLLVLFTSVLHVPALRRRRRSSARASTRRRS